jgi:hypothetical protein
MFKIFSTYMLTKYIKIQRLEVSCAVRDIYIYIYVCVCVCVCVTLVD